MRHRLACVLAALPLLATVPAHAAPTAVDSFVQPPLGNPASAAVIDAWCNRYLAEIDRRQTALEAQKGPATQATTLARFDDIQVLLTAVGGESGLLREVMADKARRDAGSACEVRAGAAGNKLSLSRPIYDRLKAIDVARADAPTRYYLKRTIEGMERSGVGLDAKGRAEVKALSDRITELGTTFEGNIAAGRKTVSADPAELDGLPADWIAQHKPGADGKVTVSTDYPDYFPVMTYARSSALHRRLSEAYSTRAYPANDKVLAEMLDLRQKLATKLGRKDFATLMLEDRMVNTPAKVEALMTDMAGAARAPAMGDFAKKLALAKSLGRASGDGYPVWDNAWLSDQVQRRSYAFDAQAMRKYFAYDEVRDGILRLTERMFGVTIRPWNTAKWDPLVEPYEMLDHGQVIGRFYFDSHPRVGKYEHANAVPLRVGIAGRALPYAALVMNLPAGDHKTGLMEQADCVTFFHEYGHLLHYIFAGKTRWGGQSGIATEWDFVEAPSQMLEEWMFDYDVLKTFARDENGNPIPRAMVDGLNRARYFDMGMADMRQLALSNISLKYHEGPAPANLGEAMRQYDSAYAILPQPAYSQFQDSFGHLAGYSAGYYTYRWSKVIALDMFSRFKREGLLNPATAAAYRRQVLAPGGTAPANELVTGFLGRPISIAGYKAEVAKDK